MLFWTIVILLFVALMEYEINKQEKDEPPD